jgi:hypothetical protein
MPLLLLLFSWRQEQQHQMQPVLRWLLLSVSSRLPACAGPCAAAGTTTAAAAAAPAQQRAIPAASLSLLLLLSWRQEQQRQMQPVLL